MQGLSSHPSQCFLNLLPPLYHIFFEYHFHYCTIAARFELEKSNLLAVRLSRPVAVLDKLSHSKGYHGNIQALFKFPSQRNPGALMNPQSAEVPQKFKRRASREISVNCVSLALFSVADLASQPNVAEVLARMSRATTGARVVKELQEFQKLYTSCFKPPTTYDPVSPSLSSHTSPSFPTQGRFSRSILSTFRDLVGCAPSRWILNRAWNCLTPRVRLS